MSAVIQSQPEPQSETAALIQAIERAAINPAVDVDKMERLFALQERMITRNAEMAFNAAMRAVQEELPTVYRNKENTQTNSFYADLEALNLAIVPIYTKHGFSLSFGTGDATREGHERVTCICSHVAGHSRPYFCDVPLDLAGLKGNANKTHTHAFGSTMSYGRRYLTMLIFNITLTNEDNDGNGGVELITEKQAVDLQAKAEEVGVDKENFLKFLKVKRLAELPASKYSAALQALRDKEQGKR